MRKIKTIINMFAVIMATSFCVGCAGLHLSDEYKGAEQKEVPFEMTYNDKEYLYICIGYGRMEYSGHSIVVNELFLGENGILVDTSLIGPEAGKEKINTVQFPVLVLKTELIEEVPLFAK